MFLSGEYADLLSLTHSFALNAKIRKYLQGITAIIMISPP